MKRVFNPRKCPYKQLKEHQGEAILVIERKVKGKRKFQLDRIRHVISKGHKRTTYDAGAFSKYETLYGESQSWGHRLYRSCFDEELSSYEGDDYTYYVKGGKQKVHKKVKYNYEQTITFMKDYDAYADLKIIHIDFN